MGRWKQGEKIMDKKIIYIDGYYINYGKFECGFENFKCVIGEWDGNEDDHDIFYYFETEKELESFKQTENRIDTEFVITKIYDKNNNVIYNNIKQVN